MAPLGGSHGDDRHEHPEVFEAGHEVLVAQDRGGGGDLDADLLRLLRQQGGPALPHSQARVQAVLHAIDQRRPGDRPVEVVLRALQHVAATSADMISPLASVRVRLIQTVPSVQGRGLQLLFSAQRNIARHLPAASPANPTRSRPPP